MADSQDDKEIENPAAGPELKLDLDTVIIEEIGQFGKYQLRILALAGLISIFSAWASMEYIFTTARISTRCLIPECESDQPEFAPYWLLNAVPGASQSSFENCQRFGNVSAALRVVPSDTCPSALFDRNTLQPCEQYVYENTHSVAYDYGLACDEWRRSLIGTIRTSGALVALPITGFVSDRWGRRVALIFTAFNAAWLGTIRYWADTYLGFMISSLVQTIFGFGVFTSAYILLLELVGPMYRMAIGAAMNTFFAIGQVTMGLIAWGVPSWRTLTLTLYIPQLSTITLYWLFSESVRWYMSKGRFNESEALLKKVAQINGRHLSDKSLEVLRHTAEEELRNSKLEAQKRGGEPWLIVQVFQHKKILFRCLISPVWWITLTFIYHGLSINAVNMSGNIYLNFIAVSAVEIPGYWTAYYLMGIIGRRPVLAGAYWVCAACQIAYIFLPQDLYAASLAVYLIAKFAIAMVATSVYVYTIELYPTRHRHSLFAFSSMMGRIGAILAPLTPAIGAQWFEDLPFVLFATFALLSGGLIFLTPETLGTKLPDTFEQAEQLGVKTHKNEK